MAETPSEPAGAGRLLLPETRGSFTKQRVFDTKQRTFLQRCLGIHHASIYLPPPTPFLLRYR